uniref:Uncharacterized protein n=1 Tax=Anguilla anguilla TaxID=7936 RepID=A0A0E9TBT0_ANGAN
MLYCVIQPTRICEAMPCYPLNDFDILK